MISRALIVDAYAPNRFIYGDWLRRVDKLEVFEASGSAQALELARQNDFALFLIDINLRGLNGFDLAAMLAAEPRAQFTPIIFVTSELSEAVDVMRGYDAGAVDVILAAPTRGEIILSKARFYVRLFQHRQEQNRRLSDIRRAASDLSARLSERAHDESGARATHDPLTHLPNRHLFRDRLVLACARASRDSETLAVCQIELDQFEALNERHNFAVGDVLLPVAAHRLIGQLRATDTVARFCEARFGVILEGVKGAQGAEWVARKLHAAVTAAYPIDSQPEAQVVMGASVGVALFPDHSNDMDRLMVLADIAKESVQREGGGVRLYTGAVAASGVSAKLRLQARR